MILHSLLESRDEGSERVEEIGEGGEKRRTLGEQIIVEILNIMSAGLKPTEKRARISWMHADLVQRQYAIVLIDAHKVVEVENDRLVS